LESFRAQNYPNLEVIVVEDGDEDGITKGVAAQYDAKYMQHMRIEKYPSFQSVSQVFNEGIKASTGDILILQAPETLHRGDVIRGMVTAIGNDSRKMAVVETALLPEHGEPTKVLGRSAGASPRALHKQTVLDIGGFEESFFGYGYEDDFFSWLLERNGVVTVRPEGVSAAHQWHPATEGAFDNFTGHANRARCWAMTLAVVWEDRPALANLGPVPPNDAPITDAEISKYVIDAYASSADPIYKQWAYNWMNGVRSDDAALDARCRAINVAPQQKTAYLATRAADAAWAIIWAKRCAAEYARVKKTDPVWADRVKICWDCHESLAAISVRVIKRILNGEALR
jgi:glycosyltransferase involved in cell wall biosynthesis